jgi:hypothetical protein
MGEPDPWKEEFDDHMVTVQNMVENSFWPSFAVACALCDKGVIDKGRLIDITEAIIGYVRADETGGLSEVDDTVRPIEQFRDLLFHLPLQPGRVLDELHTLEANAALQATRRVRNSKPQR